MRRISLIYASKREFCDVLARAAAMGYDDAFTKRNPTGRELAAHFCTAWRIGHAAALRHAYSAGRFHAEWDNKDREAAARRARQTAGEPG